MAASPYEITCTPGTLAADNYGFETGEAGELEITKATLSIDADDKSKDYGEPDPPFTYELSGFVNGEDEQSAGVTGEADCSREAGESVAASPYEITCTRRHPGRRQLRVRDRRGRRARDHRRRRS